VKHLTLLVHEVEGHGPLAREVVDLRKTGRGLGVPVDTITIDAARAEILRDPDIPWYALETWRGSMAHSLATFEFPDRMILVTGTMNRGLDKEWKGLISGSVYVDQTAWAQETYLSPQAAGAIAMWEFHKQRGV
jgi:hypothetical protein